MSAVGTEALALALVALGIWALAAAHDGERRAPYVLGLAVGLGLGVRLSWGPLFLPILILAPRALRARATVMAAAATAAWVVPLVTVVGPSRLFDLYAVHAAGHASRWGGTALTDPGRARVVFLARDIFVDGLGAGLDALGFAIVAVAAPFGVLALAAWRRASWRGARAAALLAVPYAAWIIVGQNLRQQPRHALPLVETIAVGVAIASTCTVTGRRLGALLALLVAARTAFDAHDRRTTPPPGAQLLAYVRARPDGPGIAVFGGPSVRFFERTELAKQVATAASLGDAVLALTRFDEYPRRALVTSEVDGVAEARLPIVATFCRQERIDRRAPCLSVYEWPLKR